MPEPNYAARLNNAQLNTILWGGNIMTTNNLPQKTCTVYISEINKNTNIVIIAMSHTMVTSRPISCGIKERRIYICLDCVEKSSN